jgi:hypothetical protein
MARINTGSDAGGGGGDDSGSGDGGERYRNREDPSDTRDSARGGGGQEDDGDDPLFGGGGDDGGDDDSGGGGGERYRNREDPSDTRDSARGGGGEGGSEDSSPGGEAPDDAFRDPSTGDETGGRDPARPNDPGNDVGQDADGEPQRRNKREGIEENQTSYSQSTVAAAYRLKDKIAEKYGITDPRNYDLKEKGGRVVAEFSEAAKGKIRAQQVAEQSEGIDRGDLEVATGGQVQFTDEARAERAGAGGLGGQDAGPIPTALGDAGAGGERQQPAQAGFGGGLNAPTVADIFEQDVRGAVENAGGDPDSFDVRISQDGNQFSAEIIGDVDPLADLQSAEEFGRNIPDQLDPASEAVDVNLPSSVGELAQSARDTQQGLDAQFTAGLEDATSGARSAAFDARDGFLDGLNDFANDPSQMVFAVPRAATSAASDLDSDDVAAGVTTAAAAGVVAPEPVSTGAGLAILGGAAALGIGASAARSEIDIPDPTGQQRDEVQPGQQQVDELGVPAATGGGEIDVPEGTTTELEVPTVGGAGFENGQPVAQADATQPASPANPNSNAPGNPFDDLLPQGPSIEQPDEDTAIRRETPGQVSRRSGPGFVNRETNRVERAEEATITPEEYQFPELGTGTGTAAGTASGAGSQSGFDVGAGAGAGSFADFSPFGDVSVGLGAPTADASPNSRANTTPTPTAQSPPTVDVMPSLNAAPTANPSAFADPFSFSELAEPVDTGNPEEYQFPEPTGGGFGNPPTGTPRRPRLPDRDDDLFAGEFFADDSNAPSVRTGVQSVGSTLFGDDGRERDRDSELPGAFDL